MHLKINMCPALCFTPLSSSIDQQKWRVCLGGFFGRSVSSKSKVPALLQLKLATPKKNTTCFDKWSISESLAHYNSNRHEFSRLQKISQWKSSSCPESPSTTSSNHKLWGFGLPAHHASRESQPPYLDHIDKSETDHCNTTQPSLSIIYIYTVYSGNLDDEFRWLIYSYDYYEQETNLAGFEKGFVLERHSSIVVHCCWWPAKT